MGLNFYDYHDFQKNQGWLWCFTFWLFDDTRVNIINVHRHYNFEKSQEISHSNGVLVLGRPRVYSACTAYINWRVCFSHIMAELWPASNSLLHSIYIRTVWPFALLEQGRNRRGDRRPKFSDTLTLFQPGGQILPHPRRGRTKNFPTLLTY